MRHAVLKWILLTVLAGMTSLAQAGGARVFGRLSNGAGDPIPNAVIVLCNADANLWFMTGTDGQGAFELSELPAYRFAIEILSPQWRRQPLYPKGQIWGYSPWSDSITLQAGQSLLAGTAPDVPLQSNDIVFVPRS